MIWDPTEFVASGYNARVEGAGERCYWQQSTREHGLGRGEVRGAQRGYNPGDKLMGLVISKLSV
jgi:hypothetical protein